MTINQFIEKYKGWLASTGVTAIPEVRIGDHTPVVGYEPMTHIDWRDSIGSVLSQSADVLATSTTPELGLHQVRAFYGLAKIEGDTAKMWREYLNPPPPDPVAKPAEIGARVPDDHVKAFLPSGRVDLSRKYYYQGGLDIADGRIWKAPDGKMFLSVNPGGIFVRWLMEM